MNRDKKCPEEKMCNSYVLMPPQTHCCGSILQQKLIFKQSEAWAMIITKMHFICIILQLSSISTIPHPQSQSTENHVVL